MSTENDKQQVAVVTKKEAWENFQAELEKRATEIGSQLPSNIPRDRFLNASIAAVKQTPSILTATPRSLFAALTKAAQDGLLPDGREGVITVFSQKVPNTTPQAYENVAQWNPMFYGLRKRAREIDGIIIDAQVVFVGDEFEYELGDQPFIRHKPKPRAERLDASAGLAVYAIFRHPTEGILHREVMWKPEVFDTMNQSRAKTSLMWTTFWTEGWKKTVGRRGSKSVPVSPDLERLITRDDENFEFPTAAPAAARTLPPPVPEDEETEAVTIEPEKPEPTPPKPSRARKAKPEPVAEVPHNPDTGEVIEEEPDPAPPAATTPIETEVDPGPPAVGSEAWWASLEDWAKMAGDKDALDEVWSEFDVWAVLAGDEQATKDATAIYDRAIARIEHSELKAAGQTSLLDELPEATQTAVRLGNTP